MKDKGWNSNSLQKPNLIRLYKRGPLADYFSKLGVQADHLKAMKRAASGAILGMSSPTSFEEI